MDCLEQLNSAQHDAVTYQLGNLLVLAGAGSGKTRVLVNRFAWLLNEHNQDPYNIMVVTFTNKAAKEMTNRLHKMQLSGIKSAWIGTFHGLAHKFLRQHHIEARLDNNFEVIDSEDQLKIIRRLLKKFAINEDLFEPKKVQNFINRQKDQGVRSNQLPKLHTKYDKVMFELYGYYENICNTQNVVDFAELLLRSYELLQTNAELLQHYRARFKHFLIDEFQDTNPIQYNFLKLLSPNASSVTAVGDDDQSIYGWRGAKVENIVKYTKEFSQVQVIRLEKNYRSTKTILSAANAIIDNNLDRMGKNLWTDAPQGEPIVLYGALNEEDEALFIVQQIKQHIKQGNKYSDIAILYRSNAQSRAIEECLVKQGINYTVYGGVSFFERAEIKDVLAYLRLAVNPADDAAFERIINTPTRGIGERSLEKIRSLSNNHQVSCLDAVRLWVNSGELGAIINHLKSFLKIIDNIILCLDNPEYALPEIVEKTIEYSGLLDNLKRQKDPNFINRMENLQELINATTVFDMSVLKQEDSNQALNNIEQVKALLDYAALEGKEYSKAQELNNNLDASNNQSELGYVKLMTLHAAKGLEFPMVFLCGLEEGLFPHYFSKDNQDTLNEERRLCYVGITRSMQQVFISYAQKRRLFGREEARMPSRFIREIPSNLIAEQTKKIFVSKPKSRIFKKSHHPTRSSGTKVRHNKFGMGVIIDRDGSGDKSRVHVDFGKNGVKWLLLSYANLEVLN